MYLKKKRKEDIDLGRVGSVGGSAFNQRSRHAHSKGPLTALDSPEDVLKGRFSVCLFYCSSVFLKLNFYGKFDHSLEKLKNQRS